MSDRLTELQRQRAIAQEHLAWLDKEIAALAGPSAPAPRPVPVTTTPASPAPVALRAPAPVESPVEGEAIGEAFQTDAKNAALNARKGCFVIFFVALAFVLLSFLGIYLYSVSHYGKKDPAKTPEPRSAPGKP